MGFGGGGGGSSSIATATDVALNNPANNQVLTYNTSVGKWQNLAPPTALVTSVAGKTGDVLLGKADVGLGNVDNTSDATKNAATATLTNKTISGASNTLSNIPQSAVTSLTSDLAGKEASLAAGTTGQYYRGDKSWQTLNSTAVGLGNVNNTSDANKPVSTATQTALDTKADDTITVSGGTSLTGGGNLTTNRTLTLVNDSATPGNDRYYGTNGSGTKGFYALPAGGSAADATTTSKGIVQLAGDLGGTAAAPTVPDLANKAATSTTISGGTSLSGGGSLAANRTITLLNDSASPGNSAYYGTNGSGTKGYYALPSGLQTDETRLLDSFSGATDDDKLTAALTWQQAQAGKPAIRLAARSHTFAVTRNLYSGLKLVGTPAGPRNMELAGGAHVPSRVYLSNALGSGTASWWVPPSGGGDVYDVYMADFGVEGDDGASRHQFLDYPVTTGTLYACQFHALSFNFMRGVMGRKDRKCAFTQVVLSGHWTANNLWDTQFHLGGSDNSLWMGGMINIGPSLSPAQTGTYADGDYELIFDGLSKTDVGYIYMSAMNGWRGLKIGTSASHGMSFFGGTYEGYKPTTDRAPGTVIRIEGGQGSFFGPHVGQAMASPDAAEGGYIHMTGGEWNFYGPQFFRGNTADTVPAIYQSGGRLMVTGATKLNNETWTTRPVLETGASAGNAASTGSYTTYCPDLSMNVT